MSGICSCCVRNSHNLASTGMRLLIRRRNGSLLHALAGRSSTRRPALSEVSNNERTDTCGGPAENRLAPMHSGVFYVPADLATASNLEHLVTTCRRRRGTPPQARNWGNISLAWHRRLTLAWGLGRSVNQFFLISAATAQVFSGYSRALSPSVVRTKPRQGRPSAHSSPRTISWWPGSRASRHPSRVVEGYGQRVLHRLVVAADHLDAGLRADHRRHAS